MSRPRSRPENHDDPDYDSHVDELPDPHLCLDDILQDTGILKQPAAEGEPWPIHIIGTETAVIIGMVYDYFPYMVLPIYSIMAKMDVKLLEAARDLGCGSLSVLRRVVFPLSLPGVAPALPWS